MLCRYYNKGISPVYKNTQWYYLFSQYPIENSKNDIEVYSRFIKEFHNDMWCRNVISFMLRYTKYHKYLLYRHINYHPIQTTILKLGRIWRNLGPEEKNEWIRLYKKESHIKYCIPTHQVIPTIKIVMWWKRRRVVLVKKRLRMIYNYIPINELCQIVNSYITYATPIEQLQHMLHRYLNANSTQIIMSYF